jgi:serine/threonine protein kinase
MSYQCNKILNKEIGPSELKDKKGVFNEVEKFRTIRRLGAGSFGELYLAEDINNPSHQVAIKIEKILTRSPQLRHEYKVYRELVGCFGFCQSKWYGRADLEHNCLIIDLLGGSLEDIFDKKCNRKFTLKTTLQLADQTIDRMATFHGRHLIHRDVKPANFAMGIGAERNLVYCIDFGLTKRFRDPRTLKHISWREGKSIIGTPRYASLNNHFGRECSRRDDLESVAYMLIYFLRGSLPWQGLKANSKHGKYKLILEKKLNLSIDSLCAGIPKEFAMFLKYTRDLSFEQEPDYQMCRGWFKDLYNAQGYNNTDPNSKPYWDWEEYDQDCDEDEDVDDDYVEDDEEGMETSSKNKSSEQSGKAFDGTGNDDNDNDKKRKPENVFKVAGGGAGGGGSNEKCVDPSVANSSSMDVVNQGSSTAKDDPPVSVFKVGNKKP